jgi:signal peptidase I
MTEATLPDDAANANPQPQKEESLTRFVVKLILFVVILRSFVISQFVIPSESMLPRLLVGDYLVVSKWNYGYSRHALPFSVPLIPGRIFASLPERGDVTVFKAPPGNDVDYIKRVIGLPGGGQGDCGFAQHRLRCADCGRTRERRRPAVPLSAV